jgi:hypothetical protein
VEKIFLESSIQSILILDYFIFLSAFYKNKIRDYHGQEVSKSYDKNFVSSVLDWVINFNYYV